MNCDHFKSNNLYNFRVNKIDENKTITLFCNLEEGLQQSSSYQSELIVMLLESEKPLPIINNIAFEIRNHDYKMHQEASSEEFLYFLLELVQSNALNYHIVANIAQLLIDILDRTGFVEIMNSDIIISIRETFVKYSYFQFLIEENPLLVTNLIQLFGIIGKYDTNFLMLLIENGILLILNEILTESMTSVDFLAIFHFIKISVNLGFIDRIDHNLQGIVVNYCTSEDYILRYYSISLINKFIKFNSISGSELIDCLLNALIIYDEEDIYTVEMISKCFLTFKKRDNCINDVLVSETFVNGLFSQIQKIQYTPGKYKYTDKIFHYLITRIPIEIIRIGFMNYLIISNDRDFVKKAKLDLYFDLQIRVTVQDVLLLTPLDMLLTICEQMIKEDENLKKIIQFFIRIFDSQHGNTDLLVVKMKLEDIIVEQLQNIENENFFALQDLMLTIEKFDSDTPF